MSLAEIQSEVAKLTSEERRKLTAFLVKLRHRDIGGYREKIAAKIDDKRSENWVSFEDAQKRLKSS